MKVLIKTYAPHSTHNNANNGEIDYMYRIPLIHGPIKSNKKENGKN